MLVSALVNHHTVWQVARCHLEVSWLLAHAHAPASHSSHIFERHIKLDTLVRCLDRLCPHNQSASRLPVHLALQREVRLKLWASAAHHISHRGHILANLIIIAVSVPINHHEAQLLPLLKPKVRCDRCRKLWVQIVFNLLRLADSLPARVITVFKQKALWVRLANEISVFQL